MKAVVTASAVVDFGGGADGDHLSASLDERTEGFNSGRSSFLRGANGDEGRPAFLLWSSLGHPSVPAATRGDLQVEAVGGALVTLAAQPTVSTQHDQDVVQLLDESDGSTEVSLTPPAAALPAFAQEYGPAMTVSAGVTLRDGTFASVRLERASSGARQWVAGKLTWTARARAYRIVPTAGVERVILLASGKA